MRSRRAQSERVSYALGRRGCRVTRRRFALDRPLQRSNRERRTTTAFLALAALAMATASVARPALAADVAIILSANVDEYQRAVRGFKATARHRIVGEYDMEGDFDRGRKILAEIEGKSKPDLIFAVGIWALQVVVSQATTTPVVYAMVLNPPTIVGSARNVTGASMNVPVEHTIRLFKQLGPHIKRIGVIYNQARTGYLVRRAETVARENGLVLVANEIRSSRDAIAALDAIQDGIDALWILPDETILAPTVVQQMLLFSYRKRVPLLGLSESQAQAGALLALSFASGEDIGRQAGDLANNILAGKAAGELPYTTARQVKLTVNLKAAHRLGMEIPKSVLDQANAIIQ
jgi:putative tryptophan/tyrosine transport system substrate-binding protein